ncbi:MAG: hypothetical protein ACRDR6_16890 [Pseudonocardiaceae bacterium]
MTERIGTILAPLAPATWKRSSRVNPVYISHGGVPFPLLRALSIGHRPWLGLFSGLASAWRLLAVKGGELG